jgi:type IV secretion system protein VirD4
VAGPFDGIPPGDRPTAARAKKARYYEDHQLQARILPPPAPVGRTFVDGNADKPIPAAKDDWQGAVVAPPATDTEDPANAGIRREPELPEHEDITPAPKKPAQEFDLPDDEADDCGFQCKPPTYSNLMPPTVLR